MGSGGLGGGGEARSGGRGGGGGGREGREGRGFRGGGGGVTWDSRTMEFLWFTFRSEGAAWLTVKLEGLEHRGKQPV